MPRCGSVTELILSYLKLLLENYKINFQKQLIFISTNAYFNRGIFVVRNRRRETETGPTRITEIFNG